MVFDLWPPAEGDVWPFRSNPLLGLEFHADETGAVSTLTFHERGTETLCTRVGEGPAELPDVETLLGLRGAAAAASVLDDLGTVRFSGTVRFVHAGIEGTTTATFAGDGRFADRSDFAPFGWTSSGFDGETGWSSSSFRPLEELEGKWLAQLRLQHPAVFFGDWRRHFDGIAVVRASTVRDRPCWVVRLKQGDLPAWMAHVDAETGDLLRVDSSQLAPGLGAVPQTAFLEDHRDVEGLRLPHRVTTESVVSGRVVVTFTGVEVRLAVPDTTWGPPAEE
jgi:hypothetical protein